MNSSNSSQHAARSDGRVVLSNIGIGRWVIGSGRWVDYSPSPRIKRLLRDLLPISGIKNFRFYDLRHHAITELREAGVREQTMLAIAGHVSKKMLDRYSHARMQAKRDALALLNPKSHETNHETKAEEREDYSEVNSLLSEVSQIGACGFEPQTPTVSNPESE